MKKKRTLKNGEEVEELDSSVQLIIKTKCPTKWIIEDLETGQKYRANGSTEIGKMFTPIIDKIKAHNSIFTVLSLKRMDLNIY